MKLLSLHNIEKSFGSTIALRGVSFDIDPGEIMALLGPSGCGKSTLLNIIAGLEPPDSGEILWDSRPLSGIAVNHRKFGLMFQDLALFPHLNVFENIAFGLKMNKIPMKAIQERVLETLALVRLSGFELRDVNTLSGGEAQRVALARALAPAPRFLMLDEPLGALDRNLRQSLTYELRQILKEIHQTSLYVTHDQEEAFSLADRVAVMNSGRIEQIGTPFELYQKPANLFIAQFLGFTNLLIGTARLVGEKIWVETAIGSIPVPGSSPGQVTVLMRPDTIKLDGSGNYHLSGILREKTFQGTTCRAIIEVNHVRLSFNFLPSVRLPGEGELIQMSFNSTETFQVLPGPN